MNLLIEAVKLEEKGIAFAVATIIASQGSTPRNTAKMIIKNDGSIIGTIGGGLAELYIIEEAISAIRECQSKVVEYTLNSEAADGIEMLCGGSIKVFIEVISPKPRIIMIGAGHVGYAIAKLVEFLDYQLVIIDDREEFANREKYPMAVEIEYDPDIQKAIEKVQIDRNSYIVIATKDVDLPALKAVINFPAAYIGMIGSRRKVTIAFEKLKSVGVSADKLQSVYAPVGLDIGSETPEEIAMSIMSEILKVRNGRTGFSLREVK